MKAHLRYLITLCSESALLLICWWKTGIRAVWMYVCLCVCAWEQEKAPPNRRSVCWLRVADFGVNDWNLVRWDARIIVFCGGDEWKVGHRCLPSTGFDFRMGDEKNCLEIYIYIHNKKMKLTRGVCTQNEAILGSDFGVKIFWQHRK